MNEDNKKLLLKDLCARFPYGVKVKYYDVEDERDSFDVVEGVEDLYCTNPKFYINQYALTIDKFKPYLFPMSSMTEEQKEEYCHLQQKIIYNSKGIVNKDITEYINWCYKNHLDVNDLILQRLAIDATGLNIY